MLGYRCLKDCFGKCRDPSRQGGTTADCSDIGHPGVHVLSSPSQVGCPLDPQKCGFFVSWKEVCPAIQPIEE
ncbi:hypothetical protein ES705_46148 [subsurface metagenome]